MKYLNQLICPVSSERIDENRVRLTALGVILVMSGFFITGLVVFPAILAMDYFIRAFTRLSFSPLSWLAHLVLKATGRKRIPIDKAPKIFAARIGFLLTGLSALATGVGWTVTAYVLGSVLVIFSFLECGLNFCMGCWVYSYLVYPLVRK